MTDDYTHIRERKPVDLNQTITLMIETPGGNLALKLTRSQVDHFARDVLSLAHDLRAHTGSMRFAADGKLESFTIWE